MPTDYKISYDTSCNNYKIKYDTSVLFPSYVSLGTSTGVEKTKKYSGVLPNGTYIKEVIYRNPATIILWSDGTKTVAKCSASDDYSMETGLSICIAKKLIGGTKLKKIFNDWLPEQQSFIESRVTLRDVIKRSK